MAHNLSKVVDLEIVTIIIIYGYELIGTISVLWRHSAAFAEVLLTLPLERVELPTTREHPISLEVGHR